MKQTFKDLENLAMMEKKKYFRQNKNKKETQITSQTNVDSAYVTAKTTKYATLKGETINRINELASTAQSELTIK